MLEVPLARYPEIENVLCYFVTCSETLRCLNPLTASIGLAPTSLYWGGKFQGDAADCEAKDKWESDYVTGIPRTGTMGRESESVGVRACPAFKSDEQDKTMLSLITAQLVPLAFSLLIIGLCIGTWLGELQLR
ncbi:hypothetical protein PoB_007325800 [Plakobranchus ocellatus]|uniref:Uncharacterized protein n=1 Tax=Plakobranchus ocellatus TaxID=259542 RepID=A0AAV4DR20_9GAST|nr:hypothetical protein PoB_007325800 [Plakobranchus ocellatus]